MNSLIVKKKKTTRRAIMKDDTRLDRFYKHYFTNDVIVLTEEDQRIMERWEFAWKKIGNINTKAQVVRSLMKVYKVDRKTAYRYINSAMMLFGDPQDQLREAKRAISSEWNIKLLKKAIKAEDYKAAEKLLLRFNRLHGLDKDSENGMATIMKNLKPHTIIIQGDPKSLEAEANKLMEDVEEAEVVE